MITKKQLYALIGAIVVIAIGMDYANTFFTFIENVKKADFGFQIPQSVFSIIQTIFQPVYILGASVPLILVVIISAIIGRKTIKNL
jgi:hypothetical protein